MSLSTALLCFIACHGGSGDHLVALAEGLNKDNEPVKIYATGLALKKFQERGFEVAFQFSIDNLSTAEADALAVHIAKECSTASIVITDVGSAFDLKVQEALAEYAPKANRFAYYDNPESYVPGGYSAIATQVMMAAQGILFANSNLASSPLFQDPDKEIDLGCRKKIGIGYYPLSQADKIAERRRTDKTAMRQQILLKQGLIDCNQTILVYFGGNNEEYFDKAFPAFLNLLEQAIHLTNLSNYVIMLQQHPAAKSKNLDAKLLNNWRENLQEYVSVPKIILSDCSSDDAQVIADAALYYQTSMSPQFILAGIPTLQIGHEPYLDILVKNRISPSVTTLEQLIEELSNLPNRQRTTQRERILDALGYKTNWYEILPSLLKSRSNNCPEESYDRIK